MLEALKNKKVLVLGLAKTGMSVARHLKSHGALVTVNDWAPLDENPDAQQLVQENIRVISGGHPQSLLEEDFAFMVKNPGIPYSNPMVVKAQEKGLPIITDIELANLLGEAMIIGITGSNGKTTTTQLTYDILSEADNSNGKTLLGGNIGIPTLDVADESKSEDRLVFELSSFQLMGTQQFHPHIAAILNIYPSHLDYHGSLEGYMSAKWQITKNQTKEDYLILNVDQHYFDDANTEAKRIYFTTDKNKQADAWFDYDHQVFMWQEEKVADRSDFPLPGEHNLANALVAIAIAKLLDVSNASIRHTLQHYQGVDHRLQYIGKINHRNFFNDSKATNNEAAITALKSFTTPVIWLAGGLDRGISLTEIAPYLEPVKAVVALGETAETVSDFAEANNIPVLGKAQNMDEAVNLAMTNSQEGDTILLSPAHASWDQYDSFEQRGNKFISAFEQWKKDKGE